MVGAGVQCRNARRTGGIINKSLTTAQDIYFAHTCAHEGANSVASMMLEIWTRHESELAQVHLRIQTYSVRLPNDKSRTQPTRGTGLRMIFSCHKQEHNSQKSDSPSHC